MFLTRQLVPDLNLNNVLVLGLPTPCKDSISVLKELYTDTVILVFKICFLATCAQLHALIIDKVWIHMQESACMSFLVVSSPNT